MDLEKQQQPSPIGPVMPPGIKKLSVNDFMELGFLQEVNRQFLHPRGLALSVSSEDGANWILGEIWDCRDDHEGVIFTDGTLASPEAHEKADSAAAALEKHRVDREQLFGQTIQPLRQFPKTD